MLSNQCHPQSQKSFVVKSADIMEVLILIAQYHGLNRMIAIVVSQRGEKMVVHKTMQMPSSCEMCWIRSYCDAWVYEPNKAKGYDSRLNNCPLVEVEKRRVVCNKERITAWVERTEG